MGDALRLAGARDEAEGAVVSEDRLGDIAAFQQLEYLRVETCPVLASLGDGDGLPGLESLWIMNCDALAALDGLGDVPAIDILRIHGCAGLHDLAGIDPSALTGRRILVDPGHGGRFPGAIGDDGLKTLLAQSEQVRRDLLDLLPGITSRQVRLAPHPVYDYGEYS